MLLDYLPALTAPVAPPAPLLLAGPGRRIFVPRKPIPRNHDKPLVLAILGVI